jgi:ethanolamine ammonia-lyase small subunit
VDTVSRLYAEYARGSGDRRSSRTLEAEAARRLGDLSAHGFDLGLGPAAADDRLSAIYANARTALYATVDEAVVRDACPRSVAVRTNAASRDDYLAHPPAGERLRREDARTLAAIYRGRPPQIQLIVSDGLNATAVNEQLRALLPPLRHCLAASGHHVGDTDVVVKNGRVRAGYEVGGLVGALVVIHILGERPGTGLNTVSAYLTYGRDAAGQSRWQRDLDHSATTAVCGIHSRGKLPEEAVAEIARIVTRMLEQRKSGVSLQPK